MTNGSNTFQQYYSPDYEVKKEAFCSLVMLRDHGKYKRNNNAVLYISIAFQLFVATT